MKTKTVAQSGAFWNRDLVAAGVPPAVKGGILPPGPANDSFCAPESRRFVPPGGTPGSTAGGTPAATIMGKPSTRSCFSRLLRLVGGPTQPRSFASLFVLLLLPATLLAQPAPGPVTLRDFKLVGNLAGDQAAFTLTAVAHVENAKGGTLDLLSGTVALTDLGPHPKWDARVDKNRFVLDFGQAGDFPIQIKFSAAVRQNNGWNSVDFQVAQSALQPVVLQGLGADTQFQFAGAARPERSGSEFTSFLPPDSRVNLAWKEARPEAEGKLFYAAEMLSQISVSPGLMRQVAILDFKVMQGEMSKLTLGLRGAGEVTRVQGDQVLAWSLEPGSNSADRRLVVQLNQPQKDQFAFQVQMQTPLGAFPQTADVLQLRPEGSTRFAGYFRIVNEGAVRLEVAQATGLSQISPEQFPETDATKALFRADGAQRFAYRFSGADFALRIQADQILPELSASEVLAYHLGESELSIDAEIELDIREAPLRELVLRIPKGYALSPPTAPGLSDYFTSEPPGGAQAELRIVYGQPVSGRQVIQLRLERNQALGGTNWDLPRIDVVTAKSVRGYVGASADAGFRLTPGATHALTDVATAFFPRKVAGLQTAFRLNDPAWEATLRVERLPQSVLADVFHLFSIGEGIAYGSSVMNYNVIGAPVSAFRVELSDEYFNVEFTGKDIRNWQKTDGGYVVQLHTPVAGSYTLLATYERPFKSQGETLGFTGARPLDAQTEQGHTLIISAYQFQVKPVDVSAGLLALEPAEVPPEYRLFFDAPILAAYHYTSRPFNLKLELSPLAQGDSLSQVVDRASLTTRISKEGQVLTDVRYFVKNRGNPNFRLTLPDGVQLWSATVNGKAVVPVIDAKSNLIPLPQRADPNAILTLDLKLASRSADPSRLTIAAPIVAAPVMLGQWQMEPDTGRRLAFERGSLTPVGGVADVSGFAQLARVLKTGDAFNLLAALVVLAGISVVAWRWAGGAGVLLFSARHLAGTALGLLTFALALVVLFNLKDRAADVQTTVARDLTFLAPVQQSGSVLSVEVQNLAENASAMGSVLDAWPVLLALIVWVYGAARNEAVVKLVSWILGWTLVAWAALRWPNGAPAFFLIVCAFLLLHVAIPALRQLWRLPHKPHPGASPATGDAGAQAAATILLCLIVALVSGCANLPAAPPPGKTQTIVSIPPTVAESISQQVRVEDKFAFATAKIRWQAAKGQTLPLLFEPAVLTKINYPARGLKLVQATTGGRRAQELLAQENGLYDIEVQYELQVTKRDAESGFSLPTQSALINQMKLTLVNLDVDVASPQAVSVQRDEVGSNTVAAIVLSPLEQTWIGWKPRSRDVKREKPVFYAEIYQLYVPSAGVIEGAHYAAIRPAQGELGELIFDVPAGASITDVIDPAASAPGSLVSLWRFDPDTRKLRVTLSRPQSRPFALVIRSQVATGPLPFEQTVGLVAVDGAAGQIGLLGVATGNEVQLDNVDAPAFSPINLEDFPGGVAQLLQGQIPGLTVRRAFRYADVNPSPEGGKATASLKASAVEPDVRVETQHTLSLGEDRIVLAATASVDITRAGIFRLSFVLPDGMDVESISGAELSHWTESRTNADRVITMHLRGKTQGPQQFAISLSGPGIKATNSWAVPQLIFREAGKQRGTLVIVPEQGMRLQAATRDGVKQLDPQLSGIAQKGVLAFLILQTPWNLALQIEQVDPWIQVTSLEHATVNEAQVKVLANLQYQIENTGLKAFHVMLPTNAENVHFQGDQVADFLAQEGTVTNGLQTWEIKLRRRFIGQYLLQVSYQTVMPEQSAETTLRGVQAADVNLQRGFVTIQSGGRLQVRVDAPPAALQPAEWQSIPKVLQQDLQAASANFAYRLVEPSFVLPLKLERHEAAKLLAARVNDITFTSVIADNGVMLTHVRLDMLPGDKRLLNLTLPRDARFWFAFVNQNGVWPWRDQDKYLIPLDQPARDGQTVPVEFFYTSQIGDERSPDLALLAPQFDLPLENITWRVYLNEKRKVNQWSGSLQLQEQNVVPVVAAIDAQAYLQNEATAQREKTKEAEAMLAAGNTLLQNGDPQQARRAFQAAYGLSQGDDAFNEDARVQLNNLKVQQALVGLNVRQAAAGGDAAALGGKLRDLRANKGANYTQQDAKDIIDRNTADENTAYMRLAERLVQQQDAAVSSPAAIHATIPEQGRLLTFKRAVLVDPWADLRVDLKVSAVKAASWGVRALMLAGTFVLLSAFGLAARSTRKDRPAL
jgi:hypothetical protein